MVREYTKTEIEEHKYTCIAQDFEEFSLVLVNRYWFDIFDTKGNKLVYFNTIGSRNAIKMFTEMKETDYEDFGDLFYTFQNGIWRVYAKGKEHPSTVENSALVLEWKAEVWFERIIKFLEQYQDLEFRTKVIHKYKNPRQ